MKDKSATHVKVVKDGHEGWINKNIWADMVASGKTDGFSEIAKIPVEVEELKRKKADPEPEAEVVSEELTGEVKAKTKKK